MLIIYNISIGLYRLAICLFSLWNKKAKLWIDGRKNLYDKLNEKLADQSNMVWFHVSSLGEFEQGRPLMEEYRKRFPDRKILLTFFSPSGFEIRKNYTGADFIFYLPLDSKSNARRFLDIVKPHEVFFIKYDFWYHYISQLHQRNIPVYLVSAVFRNNQMFFKWYGRWYFNLLKCFDRIFVQDNESAELLLHAGIENVSMAGDTRMDRVLEIANNPQTIEIASRFSEGKFCVVCGSTWPLDEEIIFDYILQCPNELVFIIAPHEISENHLSWIEKKLPGKTIRFSQTNTQIIGDIKVLLIDNIGMLSSLYRYAQLAYIGGGFGQGIHNTLEPAAYGIPVVFGPRYHKFNEAVNLIRLGGFFCIKTAGDFRFLMNRFYTDKEFLNKASSITKGYILQGQGATYKVLSKLRVKNT